MNIYICIKIKFCWLNYDRNWSKVIFNVWNRRITSYETTAISGELTCVITFFNTINWNYHGIQNGIKKIF